ncbi:Bug family tripartite tricarboxylate transporter substrate binding protein [Pelagibacterium sp.]|uniref:Bug family tripartite tricarboxylate transporter substrate binding protein n=1 Tax=Pelagibacterium sp. TaxID=1967288 RepID=UPI003C7D81DD
MNKLMTRSVILAFGLIAASTPAFAQYPEKDIRVIMPWGAGGGADSIVRKIMSIAEDELPTSIYIENIEGGISSIGINQVMAARPDGYTYGALTYDSVITVPWRELLADYSLDRLDLIARLTSEPNALMVGTQSEFETYEDLVAAAQAEPGSITIGVHGLGSMPHLTMLELENETGLDFRPISYPDGSAGQREAILSGEIDAAITSLGDFAPLIDSGDVRGLVEFSDTENPSYSEVPISAEVGLELQTGSFLIIAGPAGLPEDVKTTFVDAVKTAFDSEEFQDWVAGVGVTASWSGPDEVTEWVQSLQADIFAQLDRLAADGVIEK